MVSSVSAKQRTIKNGVACREPLATTVAAADIHDQRLWVRAGSASNYGSCVTVWAPGANIQSASATSDSATEYRSGTSQAAPLVAGAIALYLENRTGNSLPELFGIL